MKAKTVSTGKAVSTGKQRLFLQESKDCFYRKATTVSTGKQRLFLQESNDCFYRKAKTVSTVSFKVSSVGLHACTEDRRKRFSLYRITTLVSNVI